MLKTEQCSYLGAYIFRFTNWCTHYRLRCCYNFGADATELHTTTLQVNFPNIFMPSPPFSYWP